jgi:hypothetical protein
MAESITLDELLSACRDAGMGLSGDTAGHTRHELRDIWKCGERVLANNLRLAKQAGILKVGHRLATDVTGRNCRVPVYWLEIPKKAKAKR